MVYFATVYLHMQRMMQASIYAWLLVAINVFVEHCWKTLHDKLSPQDMETWNVVFQLEKSKSFPESI